MIHAAIDPVLIVAAIGGLLLAAGIVLSAAQVVRSNGKANVHLARAAVLGATAAADRSRTGGPFPVRTATARAAFAARADASQTADDSPHQIFALLNEYYAANINQGNTIFWASLVSMGIGFGIIFAGIVGARSNTSAAIVTTVAGVLTQFISATFLVALRSTQQQSTAYAQNLVALHLRDMRALEDARAVDLGLQLLDEIGGDGALALGNATRAALAMGLIVNESQTQPLPAPPAPAPVEEPPAAPAAPVAANQPLRARIERVAVDETRTTAERGTAPK